MYICWVILARHTMQNSNGLLCSKTEYICMSSSFEGEMSNDPAYICDLILKNRLNCYTMYFEIPV